MVIRKNQGVSSNLFVLCWKFSDFVRRASSALTFSDLPYSRFFTTVSCSGKEVEISY